MSKPVATLLWLVLSSVVADDEGNECGLYLAKSSIKNGGWGVFAGRNFAYGSRIVRLDCPFRCKLSAC